MNGLQRARGHRTVRGREARSVDWVVHNIDRGADGKGSDGSNCTTGEVEAGKAAAVA